MATLMSGYFTKVEIPTEVEVGKNIPAVISYFAKLPGAIAWSTCIMAKMGTMVKIVNVTKEWGQDAIMTNDQFKLWAMKDTKQTIYVRLFGSGAQAHSWQISEWGT